MGLLSTKLSAIKRVGTLQSQRKPAECPTPDLAPRNRKGEKALLADAEIILTQHGLQHLSPLSLIHELDTLNQAGWLQIEKPPSAANNARRKWPLPAILKALKRPGTRGHVFCLLLSSVPGETASNTTTDAILLTHLHNAACGNEPCGLLFMPHHVLAQMQHWQLPASCDLSILAQFAKLASPFRHLISPHPLFDCSFYLQERRKFTHAKLSPRIHPLLDYIRGSSHDIRHRLAQTSASFNPTFWQCVHDVHDVHEQYPDRDASTSAIPLIRFLSAMEAEPSACPTNPRRVGGVVEDLSSEGLLRGWCHALEPGITPELNVWLGGTLVGSGRADLPRTDIARRGIERHHCGFAIPLDLGKLPEASLMELNQLHFQIVTVEPQATLGRGDWPLRGSGKEHVLDVLVIRALNDSQRGLLLDWFSKEITPSLLTRARQRLLEWCSLSALAGCWRTDPLDLIHLALSRNPALCRGLEADSCTRAELVFLALAHLIAAWDQRGLQELTPSAVANGLAPDHHGDPAVFLAAQLSERCHFAPTADEQKCWNDQLRPLFNVVIATLLLQASPPPLDGTASLLESLARLAEQVFGDLSLAETLLSLIDPIGCEASPQRLRLQLRRGEGLKVAIALHHEHARGRRPSLGPFDESLALLELSKQSLITTQAALERLLPHVPAWQQRNPRFSFSRRLLDQLGWHVNTESFGLVDRLIAQGLPASHGLAVRERALAMLSQISRALWSDPGFNCKPMPPSRRPRQRWLLIGEQALSQCWLYRVEQKRLQLEQLGAEVCCIDRSQLDDWSCSELIAWADGLVFCRTPATYGVIRALTFARHAGKRVLADVDDLVFSSAFPAPYPSYAGSITPDHHLRLRLDHPLQRWPLEQADAVITSTPALADILRAQGHEVLILPNLPLPQLQGLARRRAAAPQRPAPHLVVSSGTLAHKQIWAEEVAPAVALLLERHPGLRLTLLGHLSLPSCLEPFSTRIRHLPYGDYSQYLQNLGNGSICLVPLESHPTTHCKSAIKWMEATLLGLACVTSPVRAYTDAAEPERHLLTADSQEQWVSQVERLLADPTVHQRLVSQAQQQVHALFHDGVAEQVWQPELRASDGGSLALAQRRKLLVINVFFAPQSFGGATRVAQDQVLEILRHHSESYEVTILCADHDNWQDSASSELPLDVWEWNGARVVRLAVPARPWADYEDPRVEAFCRRWFQQESFDLIHCHCCQVLTAAPLAVARDLGIPYLISLHDGWWLSPELFLVSPGGRVIDPAKPFDHIDGSPTPEQKGAALERRAALAEILHGARLRLAVSNTFRDVYAQAGFHDIDVLENRWTPMTPARPRTPPEPGAPLRLCHIGGMAIHKGYPILRQAVHLLPAGLKLSFTVVDHRMQEDEPPYTSLWNGYPVRFIPPVAMTAMADFYASQDVLIAPSIWPESFGLVTREAISAGLFVIASEVGALADPLRGRPDAGASVKPNDPAALARAIQDLQGPVDGINKLQTSMPVLHEMPDGTGPDQSNSPLHDAIYCSI